MSHFVEIKKAHGGFIVVWDSGAEQIFLTLEEAFSEIRKWNGFK